jgi:CBS-domain-containing membrane protein
LQTIRIMLQRHISALPIIDKEGRFVGIVTEGDFLRRAETGIQERRRRWLEFLIGPGRLITRVLARARRYLLPERCKYGRAARWISLNHALGIRIIVTVLAQEAV